MRTKDVNSSVKLLIDKDTEAVAALEAKFTISMVNPNISEKSFHIAGLFYLHTGQKDQAITHFRQSLSKNASFVPTMIGLGWAELQDSDTTSMFAEAMVISMRDIESILGQSMLLRKQRKSSQALDLINRLIAYSPNFIPALVERMYILLEMLSWDSLLESAQRLIGISHEDVDALTMISWFELCCEGPSENALTYLAISRKALEKLEPNNGDAMLNLCKPFARLSNRNPKILNECELMLQNSLRWNPNEPKYYIELGNLGLLQGEHSKAKESFEKASKLDPKNIEALEGIISWMIATKQYTAAEHQLEMFTELQKSLGLSASISFMNAQMSLKHLNSPETWLGCLKDALQTQLATIHGKTISLDYYVSFNPQFILTVIQNFMDNVTWSCLQENEIDRFQRILKEILEIVLRISPGSTESLYFLAKTVLMLGDSATAEIHLQKAISKSKTDLKVYFCLNTVILASYRSPFGKQEL